MGDAIFSLAGALRFGDWLLFGDWLGGDGVRNSLRYYSKILTRYNKMVGLGVIGRMRRPHVYLNCQNL